MKNWVVVSESVKNKHDGLCSYLNYLVAENHKNHINKTRIVPIHNSVKSFINNCVEQVTFRNLERAKNKRGGRSIASFGQSFIFSLPSEITLFDHQWKLIAKHIFSDLADYLAIDQKTLLKHSFINLHDEDKQHINVVVSKVIDGKVIRDIQRKAVIKLLKCSFNTSVLKYSNYNNENYIPETQRGKRYKKHYYLENTDAINALHAKNTENYNILESGRVEQDKDKQQNNRTRRFYD